MITNSWSRLRLTMITAALLLAGVIIDVSLLHWAMITVTVIAITAAIRYHGVHVVMTMTRWGSHFDVVVVLTLSSRRRYNVVDSLRLSSATSSSTTMTDDTDDVRRWTSNVVVFRHSRNPSYCMRPRDYDVHMSRRVSWTTLCPGVRLWLFIYDVCLGNFVTFIPSSLSRRDCPGLLWVLCPPPCPGVWKWLLPVPP